MSCAGRSQTILSTTDPEFMSITPFFALAMLAPNRQRSFRTAVCGHVLLAGVVTAAVLSNAALLPVAGQVLLIAGIVEGAIVIGWRLTQIPKSQVLEFLLVSPIQPKRIFLSEAAVGFCAHGVDHSCRNPGVGSALNLWTH